MTAIETQVNSSLWVYATWERIPLYMHVIASNGLIENAGPENEMLEKLKHADTGLPFYTPMLQIMFTVLLLTGCENFVPIGLWLISLCRPKTEELITTSL